MEKLSVTLIGILIVLISGIGVPALAAYAVIKALGLLPRRQRRRKKTQRHAAPEWLRKATSHPLTQVVALIFLFGLILPPMVHASGDRELTEVTEFLARVLKSRAIETVALLVLLILAKHRLLSGLQPSSAADLNTPELAKTVVASRARGNSQPKRTKKALNSAKPKTPRPKKATTPGIKP
jgi:hypothetical protein